MSKQNIVLQNPDSIKHLVTLVNEAAEAVGKVFGRGKGTGAFVLAAPIAALLTAGIVDYIDDKQQQQLQAEKERLQKEAMRKQEAIIQSLKSDAKMSQERQNYLQELNSQLQQAIEELQEESVQNEQV